MAETRPKDSKSGGGASSRIPASISPDMLAQLRSKHGLEPMALLGEGGLAYVLLTRDKVFSRELALKLSKRAGSKIDIERFRNEGRLTGQLQHPVITAVYSLEHDEEGNWFYTMKRVRGRTLDSVLRALRSRKNDDETLRLKKSWNMRRLLEVFVTVCRACSYAHSRGVIHRDIKPGNIMIGNYGEVYLLDWGLAKVFGRNLNPAIENNHDAGEEPSAFEAVLMDVEQTVELKPDAYDEDLLAPTLVYGDEFEEQVKDDSTWDAGASRIEPPVTLSDMPVPHSSGTERSVSADLDKQNMIMGTLQYMAPEQASGRIERHDNRTDIYSLGVLLWEIVVGEPMRRLMPKSRREQVEIISRISSEDGHRPDFDMVAGQRRIEPELQSCILQATAFKREDRYASAEALAKDVTAWLDGIRRWMLIAEIDFSSWPDMDLEQTARKVAHTRMDDVLSKYRSNFNVLRGKWGIRNGCLVLLSERNSIIHLCNKVVGDVRVEVTGYIEKGEEGELSPILMAPAEPVRKEADDGYCFQFGADSMTCNKLARNGLDVAFNTDPLAEQGREYTVTAEVLEGTARFQVDGREIIRLRDFFPLSGERIGLFGYEIGVRISHIRVWAAGVPRQRSCMVTPDAFFAREDYLEALREYGRIIESHEGSEEADEATFKAGRCCMKLARAAGDDSRNFKNYIEAAETYFRELLAKPMSALGLIGLAEIDEQTGRPVVDQVARLVEGLQFHTSPGKEGVSDLILQATLKARACRESGFIRESLLLWKSLADCRNAPAFLRARALIEAAIDARSLFHTNETYRLLKKIIHDFADQEYHCARALREIGRTRHNSGDFTGAREAFDKLLNDYTRSEDLCAWTFLDIGDTFRNSGRFEKALEVYGRVLEEFTGQRGQCAAAYQSSADVLFCLDRIEESRIARGKVLDKYRGQKSWCARALIGIGDSYLEEGLYKKAGAAFDEVAGAAYSSVPAWCVTALCRLAKARMLAGETQLAHAALDQASTDFGGMDEYVATVLLQRGIVFQHEARFEEAAGAFSELYENARYARLRELCSDAMLYHAEGFLREKSLDKAAEKFHAVTELFPDQVAAQTAAVWLAAMHLADAGGEPDAGKREKQIASAKKLFEKTGVYGGALVTWESISRLWWAKCLHGVTPTGKVSQPFQTTWPADEAGTALNPAEVLRRTEPHSRSAFRKILDYLRINVT